MDGVDTNTRLADIILDLGYQIMGTVTWNKLLPVG